MQVTDCSNQKRACSYSTHSLSPSGEDSKTDNGSDFQSDKSLSDGDPGNDVSDVDTDLEVHVNSKNGSEYRSELQSTSGPPLLLLRTYSTSMTIM